jgi:primosomal protein N' (replication factor Y) (superfamily II helicase)
VSKSPILKVAVNVPLSREFDYLPPAQGPVPVTGQRVMVPFGRRQQVGMVLGQTDNSELPATKLKACHAVLDRDALLSDADVWLIRFTSDYYHHPIGEVVAAALPALLRQGKPLHPRIEKIAATTAGLSFDLQALSRRAPKQAELLEALLDAGDDGIDAELATETFPGWRILAKRLIEKGLARFFESRADDFNEVLASDGKPGPELNPDQQQALSVLRSTDHYGVYLLDGVTGSGKTEVYLQRVDDVLRAGKQALLLVPEIGLTPQLVTRLRERLGIEPALQHSGLSDSARLAAWRAARSGAARLLVGTRSAIFTPMKDPGLIIVDEEHDPSFKQQEGLRYSARDLAIARARQLDIPVILGSATPTLEMLQHCRSGAYQQLVLPARAGRALAPSMRLIDTVRMPTTEGISAALAESIRGHLADDGQILIFLNRRGFAPTLICGSCGHVADCERCDSRMTVHAARRQLNCHHCGAARPLCDSCEECGEAVKPLGEGTERLEESLQKRFPRAVISRIDSDSTQLKGAMVAALEGAAAGKADILVGTQMLSKGHHFPNLTLVGIVNADQGLFGTDFRSSERLAQAIIQVAGRAGRENRPGEVLIQTAFPENPFWEALIKGGYRQISDSALKEREMTRWPPFTRLALLRSAAYRKTDAHRFLEIAKRYVGSHANESIRVLGPVDAPMARKAGRYRAQLLLQSSDRAGLHRVLRELRPQFENDASARKVRWSIDVDPIELF